MDAAMDIVDLDVEDDDVDDLFKRLSLFQIIFSKLFYHFQDDKIDLRINEHCSNAVISKIKFTLPESLCIFRI